MYTPSWCGCGTIDTKPLTKVLCVSMGQTKQLPIPHHILVERYLSGATAKNLAAACECSISLIERRLQGVQKRKIYPKTCLEEGCSKPSSREGYCPSHYRVRHVRGEFSTTPCAVDSCDRMAVIKGLCNTHYSRMRRGTPLDKPIKTPAPRGSGYIDSEGYRRIGRKKEHRLVMERVLKRPLSKWEHVHHLNGDKLDNRPKNLELWIGRQQPRGRRVSDAVADAVETLQRYAPEKLQGHKED